jgi:hypothetical protein
MRSGTISGEIGPHLILRSGLSFRTGKFNATMQSRVAPVRIGFLQVHNEVFCGLRIALGEPLCLG